MFTGSFRPTTGTRHLHRDYSFTGSLVETAPKSLRHSCRSELTRQGISLQVLFGHVRTEQHFLWMPFPACRHAEGTISSSATRMSGVWSLRIPANLRAFPADCPHPTHFHCRPKPTSSAGYSEFPAYSRMHTASLPMRGAANYYLRTVIVTAAVYRGLGSRLRPKANHSP